MKIPVTFGNNKDNHGLFVDMSWQYLKISQRKKKIYIFINIVIRMSLRGLVAKGKFSQSVNRKAINL